jgi:hypothetical protein
MILVAMTYGSCHAGIGVTNALRLVKEAARTS